jgi:hypothetical protein
MLTGLEFISGTGNHVGVKDGRGHNNIIAASDTGIYLTGGQTGIFGNTICAFSYAGIYLNGGNGNYGPPAITWACPNAVSGTASAGDYIEVFLAEPNASTKGGSLAYLGSTTTATGVWSVTVASGLSAGDYVVATASDNAENTSSFSLNQVVTLGPPTPTAVATPTATISPTPGPSSTATAGSGDLTGGAAVRAYPNPGKDQVHFVLNLSETSDVKINLYNLNGERVAGLRQMLSGQGATLTWACRGAGAGIYLARISINGREVAKRKVAVMR